MIPLYIFLLALAMDLLGEPPESIHPVVWIGKTIRISSRSGNALFITISCISFWILLIIFLLSLSFLIHPLLGIFVSAYFLKSTFSIRCLLQKAKEVKELIKSDLEKAREELKWLVGRNTRNLSKEETASATIESIAENYVDAILSPIFFFLIFSIGGVIAGVAAAIAYKVIDTMDSMLGYPWIPYGKLPAVLDDIANFIPARISISPFILLSFFSQDVIKIIGRDHRKAGINSGYPISAVSGMLKVKLRKPGFYTIGEGREPIPEDISKGIKLILGCAGITLLVAVFLLL
jgi:adenosylcobinamide-phosphate synthase